MTDVIRPDATAPGIARQGIKWRKLGVAGWIGASVLVLFTLIAVFVPVFSTEASSSVFLNRALQKPIWMGGTWEHPLGTDQLGRSVLLQLAMALRISAVVAVVSVFLAGAIGVVLGLVSGYRGGWVDFVVARFTEAQMALPLLIVAMVLVVALGPSLPTIVIAIALSGWVPFARLVRSETMALRGREFVVLAKISGVDQFGILVRHLLPNVLPATLILATQQVAVAVIEEAALSFLGLGIQPPEISLGSMVGQTRILLQTDPWLPLIPVVVLVAVSLAVNLLGDRIRNAMDVVR